MFYLLNQVIYGIDQENCEVRIVIVMFQKILEISHGMLYNNTMEVQNE